ncbi:16S rRNA (cytidine(1402)-2'-O)-methyltransferase [Rothia sp. CCM 9419]|uniref:16S rRNA (cytidine(1402)-2'-O)-methyltransferase n=1 Tax=Rothia sp. CCM 9419 TaxID=3402662 RepID=UPI003AD98A27
MNTGAGECGSTAGYKQTTLTTIEDKSNTPMTHNTETNTLQHTTTPESAGVLILGGTPIGNLSDTTDRLKHYLQTADLIAVEDTRTLRRLLSGLGLQTHAKIITNHDHNETQKTEEIIHAVRSGETVLLLSDAGMPTISDPGYIAAQAVAAEGLPVSVAPGPSAVLSALAVSGLPSGRFTFEGFLARKGSERTKRLNSLATEERTMIFYESPHRLAKTLQDMSQTFGPDRQAVVCRELTKLHEEILRNSLAELTTWAQNTTIRGEIALVVAGAETPETPEPESLVDQVHTLVDQGMRLKQACAHIGKQHGVSTKELYNATLASRN